MRRLIVALFVLLALAALPVAQGGGFRLPRGWPSAGVTEEQRTAIYKVQGEFNEKIDKLEAEIAALRAELMFRQLDVLSDAQRQVLVENAYLKLAVLEDYMKWKSTQGKSKEKVVEKTGE